MKVKQTLYLAFLIVVLVGCASSYKKINPKTLNYISKNTTNDLVFEYKYDLLDKKYKKKEGKNNLKVVAIKITNNSDVDYVFGNNLNLVYENGNSVLILDNEITYKSLKQSPASYLWYLLLSPLKLYKTSTDSYGRPVNSVIFPIGIFLGPGLAGGNMYGASQANKNFKKDLNDYEIIGKPIKKGETVYGIIGIKSDRFEGLKLKIN